MKYIVMTMPQPQLK